jgi:hypothetical protein
MCQWRKFADLLIYCSSFVEDRAVRSNNNRGSEV